MLPRLFVPPDWETVPVPELPTVSQYAESAAEPLRAYVPASPVL